jgi:hypothetical protein
MVSNDSRMDEIGNDLVAVSLGTCSKNRYAFIQYLPAPETDTKPNEEIRAQTRVHKWDSKVSSFRCDSQD